MNRLAVTPFLFCSLLALAVTACGDDGGNGDTPDAMVEPGQPDAMKPSPPDAGPEVPPDAATPPDAMPPTPEIVVSATTLSVNEGSIDGAEITIKLSASPRGPLAVNVASSDPGAVVVAPASLNFSDADFATEQTLTITAPNDVDGNNESLTLTFSATGLADVTVDVTVIDDDSLNILASATTVTVDEEDTATFDVSLTVQPNQDVTVTVASDNEGKATADVATLTFTQANYDQPQTVTISGVADADVADDAATVTLSSAGLTDVTVAVTVADDDTQTIQISNGTVNVNEEGADGSFTVRLSNDPLGTVEVTVASSDGGAATASPSTLTFDSSNYDQEQTVTVSGTADADVADENGVTLTLSAQDIADATVTVNVNDDDTQTILVGSTSVSVDEGATGQFTVRLSNDPLGSFTVTLTSTDTGAATVSPTSLTFDSSNYADPQTVTATGVGDTDRNAESVPVRLSGTGVADVTVTVNVADNTPPFAVDMFVNFDPETHADERLIYLGNNRYATGNVTLGAAVHNFKITDTNVTAGTTFATNGPTLLNPTGAPSPIAPVTLVATTNPNNKLLLTVNSPNTFTFRFELNATSTTNPVLTVVHIP